MHTILVVDDSLSVRQLLQGFLSDNGFSVRSAEDGFRALEEVGRQTPELLIVDINMPGMTGLQLIQTLRERADMRSVPIIVLTTEVSKEMMAEGKRVGATAWMPKPFKPKTLLSGIRSALGLDP